MRWKPRSGRTTRSITPCCASPPAAACSAWARTWRSRRRCSPGCSQPWTHPRPLAGGWRCWRCCSPGAATRRYSLPVSRASSPNGCSGCWAGRRWAWRSVHGAHAPPRASGMSPNHPRPGGGVGVTWAEWAATLRPFEPVYQRELGLALADRARQTGDRAGLAAALARLATASSLQGGRNAETLLDLARARLEWDLVEAQPSAVPLEFAQRALALDPANPLLYADAADLALRQGRLDEGRQYWEAARSRARSPDALLRVGEVGLRLGEPLAARMALREAARREWRRPLQAEVYRVWGAAALAAGLPEEAAQAYGEALRRDPGDVEARVQRAQALAEAGRREEASREARAALRLAPDNPQAAALLVRLSAP